MVGLGFFYLLLVAYIIGFLRVGSSNRNDTILECAHAEKVHRTKNLAIVSTVKKNVRTLIKKGSFSFNMTPKEEKVFFYRFSIDFLIFFELIKQKKYFFCFFRFCNAKQLVKRINSFGLLWQAQPFLDVSLYQNLRKQSEKSLRNSRITKIDSKQYYQKLMKLSTPSPKRHKKFSQSLLTMKVGGTSDGFSTQKISGKIFLSE